VSRFQKIFLASALVVVGFGVAKFLGQPVLPAQADRWQSPQARSESEAVQKADSVFGGTNAAARVRLLPDRAMLNVAIAPPNAAGELSQRPALGIAVVPAPTVGQAANSIPIAESDGPRAKLRNEAPRPIGIDPKSPATIRRAPAVEGDNNYATAAANSQTTAVNWPAPQLLNAGNRQPELSSAGQWRAERLPPRAIAASYNEAAPAEAGQIAPPPWPAPEEGAELRTHIVIDGDSLEKLAGRYLGDPQRSHEIYELNREVLSAPDLLPIGAELKVPKRLASATWADSGYQPNSASSSLQSNPASLPGGIIPRAQLAAPVMVQ
jgi:nucleoid-associated protein YgaU